MGDVKGDTRSSDYGSYGDYIAVFRGMGKKMETTTVFRVSGLGLQNFTQ